MTSLTMTIVVEFKILSIIWGEKVKKFDDDNKVSDKMTLPEILLAFIICIEDVRKSFLNWRNSFRVEKYKNRI